MFLVPPFATEVAPLDVFVDILSEASGDIPVFGGLPSSSMAEGDILTFAEGAPHSDRAAVILLDGNVRPLFAVKNILSFFSEKNGVVTKASGNVVYEIDGKPFVEYLRSVGMDVDSLIAEGDLAVHVSTPLRVHLNKNNDTDGIAVSRTIKALSAADGSGVLFGAISEKSIVSVATMRRKDIEESCQAAVKEISDKIDAAGGDYKYTTVLCISCCARYMVMANDRRIEGNILTAGLPEGLDLAGYYAYGEICPTLVENGRALNRVHNESIVLCAL
jgi:hypothetical protein